MIVSEQPLNNQDSIRMRLPEARDHSQELDSVVLTSVLHLEQAQVAPAQISSSNCLVLHLEGVVADDPETRIYVEMTWRRELASASWTPRRA